MSIDLEERLRTMYAAVADTTEVREELVAVGDVPEPHRSIGRRRAVALVAVAAVLIVGLVVVVTHHRSAEPAAPLKDRPFAVATWVPEGFGIDQTIPYVNPGPGIHGFDDSWKGVSFTRYTGPSFHDIIVATARHGSVPPLPGTRTVTLASGAVAQLTRNGEFVTVAWVQPGGYATSVYAQGITDNDAVKIAVNIWWVTEQMWQQVTAKAGFPSLVLDAWTPPGAGGSTFTLTMRGSLQKGFAQTYEVQGGTIASAPYEPGPYTDVCQWNHRGGLTHDAIVILSASVGVEAFRVTLPDGTTTDVVAGMPPGMPSGRVATIVVHPKKGEAPNDIRVQCIGANP
jgi:hypothetical protein